MYETRKHGFTLIELLVVMAIIGILAGLLFPALVGAQKKSKDTAARDLCIQVATAWKVLAQNHGRFPNPVLLADTKKTGTDVYFQMTPANGCVLNWWEPKSPSPLADKATYDKKFPSSEYGQNDPRAAWDLVETKWPPDVLLERTVAQKRWGLYAPYKEREVAEQNTFDDVFNLALKKNLVWVAIDSDADGFITPPADVFGECERVRASALSWVSNEDGKIIKSW